ncbi:MAG: DegV family protein [Oscillibacter sp.]|nr:DegV family protein [Oscillibacter sp.]
MVRIVSDTSTLYSSKQAEEAGFSVAPLSVTIGGETYREFDEISSQRFVEKIREGNMPTSSQPAIGEVAEVFEKFPEDEILNISMAHGLSGTYNSACSAAELVDNSGRITVLNSRTLCGPHRYMVENAVRLAKEGKSKDEILADCARLMETDKSYLMPDDFEFLRRGGRVSSLVSYVGRAAHLVPVMTQTEDTMQLTIAGVRRGFEQAIKYVGKCLEDRGVGKGWRVYITHADAMNRAQRAHEILTKLFPEAIFEIHPLSPAFITQGGPGCVAVQIIHE